MSNTVSQAVLQAMQATLGQHVNRAAITWVPALSQRALYIGGAGLLLWRAGAIPGATASLSLRVSRQLVVYLAVALVVSVLPSNLGHTHLPLTLATMLATAGIAAKAAGIPAVAPLLPGVSASCRYVVSAALAGPLATTMGAGAAATLALAAVLLQRLLHTGNSVVGQTLTMTSVTVLKTVALRGLPAGLRMVAAVAVLVAAQPLATRVPCIASVNDFLVYEAGNTAAEALSTWATPAAAMGLVIMACLLAPSPLLAGVGQVAAAVLLSQGVLAIAKGAIDTDPIPTLLNAILVLELVSWLFTNVFKGSISKSIPNTCPQ